MKLATRTPFLVWSFALILALSFLVWSTHRRLQRIEYVSALASRAEGPDTVLSHSPTGYADGQRELIIPERNEASYAWIEQTEEMLSQHAWRIRRAELDNAPKGRPVYSTSPYRWWLGAVAAMDHAISGRPMGRSVERAALLADPLLQGLFLVAASLFAARRFGSFAAAILSLGLVMLFPWGAAFLPGAPDHHALARVCALGSALLFFAAFRGTVHPRLWLALAGVIGGLGLWVDAATLVPVLGGLFLGPLLANLAGKRLERSHARLGVSAEAWRIWSLAGSVTVGLAYLIEYFPADLGTWRLQVIHPLYGLAWLGAGELLSLAAAPGSASSVISGPNARVRIIARALLSIAAIVSVPIAMRLSASDALFARDMGSFRLTGQPNGVVAANTWAWLTRDGVSAPVLAIVLSFVVLVFLGWFYGLRSGRTESRLVFAAASGAVVLVVALAAMQLAWWALAGGLLLVGVVALLPSECEPSRINGYWLGAAIVIGGIVVPGALQLCPRQTADATMTLTAAEAQELIDRDLAHWLAKHAEEPGAIVYAPPHSTASLAFFGGLRGVGTFAPENRAGFGVSLMIAAANTLEEAQALLQARDVRYLVVPSWDPFFDNFAELYLDKRFSGRTSFLIGNLRRFNIPAWLRPMAYQMPEISGYEGQSVLVFQMVDEQAPAVAASRVVEYLLETGRVDQAFQTSAELRRFPGDVGALTARAQVAIAREDPKGLAQAVDALVERLANGGDRYLAWDRRVSLAIVLAQANKIDLAQPQLQRCMDESTTDKIKNLSAGGLYRLLVLSQALKIPFPSPQLQALALELLPRELRSRL